MLANKKKYIIKQKEKSPKVKKYTKLLVVFAESNHITSREKKWKILSAQWVLRSQVGNKNTQKPFFCKREHYDLKYWSISNIFILLSYAQQSFHFTANNNLWVIRLARAAVLPGRWRNSGKTHVWDRGNRASGAETS